MEPQNGDAVGVDHVRIEVAVGVVVRNHLATTGEAHGRAEVLAVIVFELLAVPALAVEPLDAAHDPECGRAAAAAAELDMVAAREIELLVIDPPGHVQMHAADAVLVVRDAIRQLRNVARHRQAGRVGQITPDDAARVRQAVRKTGRLRVEQDSRRLTRARGENDDAGAHGVIAAVGAIDVGHAGCEPARVGRHLAGHRIGDDAQPAGGERRRQQHRRRRKVRMRGAAAAALPAVVTGGAPIERPGQNRQPRRNAGDVESIARLLHHQLVAARTRRWKKDPVGFVRKVFNRAENADQSIELVVVRFQIVVADRPVVAKPIDAAPPEIIGAKSERNAAPVVGPAAEHPRPEPVERRARRLRVRLAFQFPAADAAVEFAKRLLGRGRAAPGRVVRPGRHLRLLFDVPHRAGLEHHHVGARFAQDLGRHPAARA